MSKRTALDLLGVLSPGASSVANPQSGDPPLVKTLIPGVASGIVGYKIWKKHPVLGFFSFEALGQNAYRLYRDQGVDRTRAFTNLSATGAGVVASLKSPNHPFFGFLGGFAVAQTVLAFIPGSNMYNFVHKSGTLKDFLRGK